MSKKGLARQVLEKAGFNQPFHIRHKLILLIVALVIAGFIVLKLASYIFNKDEEIDILSAIIAFGALIFGFQQWNESKNETSIDRYYERLTLTNSKLTDSRGLCQMFPHFWEENDFEKTLYVYLELDNLEYAITKYHYGYMHTFIAYRSLLTFISRCQSAEFLKLAKTCVKGSIGYHEMTQIVVNNIANPEIQRWLSHRVSVSFPVK